MIKIKKYGSEIEGPVSTDDFYLFKAIINGETYESYAEKIDVTRQAVQKRFKKAFVNLYPIMADTYKNKNLRELREIFNEIKG